MNGSRGTPPGHRYSCSSEAIAIAAAGFLFGREVHHGAAQAAQARAATAEDGARTLGEVAANGLALASAPAGAAPARGRIQSAIDGLTGP
jgi:hypothetical protein